MVAPFAAAFGWSLRSAPPLPPMGEISPELLKAAEAAPVLTAPATTISLASTLDAVAVFYFYGFLMFLLLGAARHIWFSYRVAFAFELDEPNLEAGLEAWRTRIGIKRQPRYAFSDAVSSVCVNGIFRPVILMPHNLLDQVSIDDAVLMGAHEMAHIKRGDTSLFAFCTIVKAVFWFKPLHATHCRTREPCCRTGCRRACHCARCRSPPVCALFCAGSAICFFCKS